MDSLLILLPLSAAILLGAISPGPSFVVVARTAIANSRATGVLVALGMGIGGAIFAIAALLGLQLLLSAVPALYTALKIAGASYLLYIAYNLWKGAAEPLVEAESASGGNRSNWQAFLLGLGTQLSNPKTAIVYASVFSAVLPKEPTWEVFAVLVPSVFAIEFGWYMLVALVFSTRKAQRTYIRGKTRIDRLAACAIGGLGPENFGRCSARLNRG